MNTIAVRYALPDPALFDFVPVYLEAAVSGGEITDLLPPDMPSLRFNIEGTWLHGASQTTLEAPPDRGVLHGTSSKAHWIAGEGTGFAIGLNPLVWPGLLGKRADDVIDQVVPLGDFLGPVWNGLIDAICGASDFEGRVAAANSFLLAAVRPPVREPLQSQIVAIRLALADPDCGSVAELALRAGVSTRQLERIARTCFGFTPKTLIRRERFRRMLHRADAMSYRQWRDFLDLQYVDQSHMIREFKHFMGMPPSRYFALERPLVSAAFQSFWALMGVTPDRTYWARDSEPA